MVETRWQSYFNMASRVESIRWALDNHTKGGIHPVRRIRRGGMV